MPRAIWPLRQGRPQIEVIIRLASSGQELSRRMVADTGAGTRNDVFELILDEDDCLLCGGIPLRLVRLSGAFAGEFPVYLIEVLVPALQFDGFVPVVGVPTLPRGFDGIACFRFLSRFTYGNFGDDMNFGLENLP